jgi:hypothetical protein
MRPFSWKARAIAGGPRRSVGNSKSGLAARYPMTLVRPAGATLSLSIVRRAPGCARPMQPRRHEDMELNRAMTTSESVVGSATRRPLSQHIDSPHRLASQGRRASEMTHPASTSLPSWTNCGRFAGSPSFLAQSCSCGGAAAPPLGAALPRGQVRWRAREAANPGQPLPPNRRFGGQTPGNRLQSVGIPGGLASRVVSQKTCKSR